MKKIIVVIWLFFAVTIQGVEACSPPSTEFIEIRIADCVDNDRYSVDEYPTIDIMIKESSFSEDVDYRDEPNGFYKQKFPEWENYSYLEEEGYVSIGYTYYLVDVEYQDCRIYVTPRNGYDVTFAEFYVVAFDDNGTELFRSSVIDAYEFVNHGMKYVEVDYDRGKITVEELEFDGCAGAYELVFGVFGFLGFVLYLVLLIGSFIALVILSLMISSLTKFRHTDTLLQFYLLTFVYGFVFGIQMLWFKGSVPVLTILFTILAIGFIEYFAVKKDSLPHFNKKITLIIVLKAIVLFVISYMI